MPITLLLLLLAFGSLVAAFMPLGIGVLSISMALGAAALLAHYSTYSILVQNLATMLGLGLGIDYALLMVSRFREALAERCSPRPSRRYCRQASREDAAHLGHHRGHRIFRAADCANQRTALHRNRRLAGNYFERCALYIHSPLGAWPARTSHQRRQSAASMEGIESTGSFLRGQCALGALGQHHNQPAVGRPDRRDSAAASCIPGVANRARHSGPQLAPGRGESVQALRPLQGMGRSGIVQSLRVVLELPPQSAPLSRLGGRPSSRLTKHFQEDPRAEEVLSLPTLTGMADNPEAVNDVPEAIRKSFIRTDGQATLIELLPTATLVPNEQIRWVREVRSSDIAAITGVPGAVVRVGGIAAIDADYASVVKEWMPSVVLGVVLGSLLALLIGLRSVFAAIKAILLNLLSVGASFGALVVVFQKGYGSRLFGLDGPTGTVFPIVPILSFAIVFGLSVDYEVFLVARVLEERGAVCAKNPRWSKRVWRGPRG